MNSTWLITSELANQSARKVLFTCVVYTKHHYSLTKTENNDNNHFDQKRFIPLYLPKWQLNLEKHKKCFMFYQLQGGRLWKRVNKPEKQQYFNHIVVQYYGLVWFPLWAINCCYLHRGYYTVVRRYEFYVRVARTISHEWAQRTSKILLLPRVT